MTEVTETKQSAVEQIAEEMKTPAKFNFADAINQTSYPTGKVTIYLDGAKAGELMTLAEQILDLQARSKDLGASSSGGIVDDPEKEAADAEIATLQVQEAELAKSILASKLTLHMRGVAPAVWRAIDKKARATVKPATKSEEDVLEANITRNNYVNNELIAHAITSIENADGAVDDSAVSVATVEHLYDVLIESEWYKIHGKMQELTFANQLFAKATEQDADFLPQP